MAMESQIVFVNGKQRKAYIIRGREYVREGFDIPVPVAERFEKKCDLLGEDKSKIVEKLVTAFISASGWGKEVKEAPFEYRSGYHVREAVEDTTRGMFPWLDR